MVCGGMKPAHGRPVISNAAAVQTAWEKKKKRNCGRLRNKQEHSNAWEADLLVGCGKMYCRYLFSWLRRGRGKLDLLVALVLFCA